MGHQSSPGSGPGAFPEAQGQPKSAYSRGAEEDSRLPPNVLEKLPQPCSAPLPARSPGTRHQVACGSKQVS